MASKSNGLEPSEWARAPPPTGPVWQQLAKAVYNPEEKSFLGRTPRKWGIVLVFYGIFYAVLALLFSICMAGLFMTIDDRKPSYTLGSSLIGLSPGVAARPRPEGGYGIMYKLDNDSSLYDTIDQLEEFLQPYQDRAWFNATTDCKKTDNYGLPRTPCFYIKINKIYDWEPQYYDPTSLPEDMPADLKDHIQSLAPSERKKVWISCANEGSSNTQFEYPWGRGMSYGFFPYTNQKGYLSPLVAVKVQPLLNTPLTFRCRAWAKNIVYNKSLKDPSGYTRILVKIQSKETTE